MLSRILRTRFSLIGVVASILVAGAFTALDVVPAASLDATLRTWRVEPSEDLMSPWSGQWGDVPPLTLTLSAQNATKPLGGGEVATIKARALNDGSKVYIALEWRDKTVDDSVNGHTVFADSAAVELPAVAGLSIPSFCMGDATGTVNIWHWKAAWQRDMDEGFTSVRDRYPDGFTDGYPIGSEAIYQPARSLGNLLSQTEHATPVENLVAANFGTLTTADLQDVQGRGEWKDGRWRVVFARDLSAAEGYPSLKEAEITNVAFAVWDGSKGNRNGIKSVSQFMNLQISASPPPGVASGFPWWGWAVLVAVLGTAGVGLGSVYFSGGNKRAS